MDDIRKLPWYVYSVFAKYFLEMHRDTQTCIQGDRQTDRKTDTHTNVYLIIDG